VAVRKTQKSFAAGGLNLIMFPSIFNPVTALFENLVE
jgi:hypothetical protein